MSENLMSDEVIRLGFEDFATELGMDLSSDFFNQRDDANRYTEQDTRLAFKIWCAAVSSWIESN